MSADQTTFPLSSLEWQVADALATAQRFDEDATETAERITRATTALFDERFDRAFDQILDAISEAIHQGDDVWQEVYDLREFIWD